MDEDVPQRDEEPVLYRNLTADALGLTWIIVGVHRGDDGEGVAGIIGIELGDAHEVGAQVARHLLDVARGDLRRVKIRLGREDIAFGRIPDHVDHRVGPVRGGSVDEEVPIGIVALPLGPPPRDLARRSCATPR